MGLGLGLQVPPPLWPTVRLHLADGGHAELEIRREPYVALWGLTYPREAKRVGDKVFRPVSAAPVKYPVALSTRELILRSSSFSGSSGRLGCAALCAVSLGLRGRLAFTGNISSPRQAP